MTTTAPPIFLAGAQLGSVRLSQFRGDDLIDTLRTHPLVIIGGILQQNPFFVPPEQFLNEFRARRTSQES
jgi:hypothetical protein